MCKIEPSRDLWADIETLWRRYFDRSAIEGRLGMHSGDGFSFIIMLTYSPYRDTRLCLLVSFYTNNVALMSIPTIFKAVELKR